MYPEELEEEWWWSQSPANQASKDNSAATHPC